MKKSLFVMYVNINSPNYIILNNTDKSKFITS